MLQCKSPCPDPIRQLGTVLYAGAFTPHFPAFPTPNHQPQQNFTVTVPHFTGQVQLAALAYTLVGVSAVPFLGFALLWCGALNKELVLQIGPSSTIEQASELLNVQPAIVALTSDQSPHGMN
jgi:hypothetical protein